MVKYLLTILILFVFSATNFAQHAVGVNWGHFGEPLFPYNFNTIGLTYQIKNPCDTCEELTIWIEESYESVLEENNERNNYVNTGVGFDLFLGNRLFYVIGGGLLIQILAKPPNYYGEYKQFVFSGKGNTGVGYKFSEQFFITLLGVYVKNISTAYTRNTTNPAGMSTGVDNIKGQYMFISLSLNYIINKEN